MTLIAMSFNLNAAEYRTAEVTAPRSVDDIDTTLSNVSNQILFYRGPVVKAIDDWRKSRGPYLRDGDADKISDQLRIILNYSISIL